MARSFPSHHPVGSTACPQDQFPVSVATASEDALKSSDPVRVGRGYRGGKMDCGRLGINLEASQSSETK